MCQFHKRNDLLFERHLPIEHTREINKLELSTLVEAGKLFNTRKVIHSSCDRLHTFLLRQTRALLVNLGALFSVASAILKPFLDEPIRLLFKHLIPIVPVLDDSLKGATLIFSFRR
jgi:hypothetical protein